MSTYYPEQIQEDFIKKFLPEYYNDTYYRDRAESHEDIDSDLKKALNTLVDKDFYSSAQEMLDLFGEYLPLYMNYNVLYESFSDYLELLFLHQEKCPLKLPSPEEFFILLNDRGLKDYLLNSRFLNVVSDRLNELISGQYSLGSFDLELLFTWLEKISRNFDGRLKEEILDDELDFNYLLCRSLHLDHYALDCFLQLKSDGSDVFSLLFFGEICRLAEKKAEELNVPVQWWLNSNGSQIIEFMKLNGGLELYKYISGLFIDEDATIQ